MLHAALKALAADKGCGCSCCLAAAGRLRRVIEKLPAGIAAHAAPEAIRACPVCKRR